MPSLTCKGGVGEGFAVPGSKSVQADAKWYYPIFQLLRIRRSWLQIVSAYCPIPPTPLYTRGAWPAHIDTQYVQPTKQQFVGMLRQADQHIRLLHTQKGKHDETICSYYSLRFVAGWDDRVSFQRQYSTH